MKVARQRKLYPTRACAALTIADAALSAEPGISEPLIVIVEVEGAEGRSMCTVTWVHDNEGYQLLFNRDEQRTRKPAASPRLAVRDGVCFLAPVDGDFGGTWIGVNEFGVSVCLLNGANLTRSEVKPATPVRSESLQSRALLLLDFVAAPPVAAACERLRKTDLSAFEPCTIAAIEPGRPASLVEWNGAEKTVVPCGESYLPLTSSSFDAEGARTKRRDEYLSVLNPSGQLNANLLFAFHQSHGPAPSAYSPCMHRADAETVSFSWIRVTASEVDFFYTPAAPCKQSAGECRKLALPSRC